MKILFGKFGHEANTFCTHTASYEMFTASGSLVRGDQLFTHFKEDAPDYISGMISCGRKHGAELIPTMALLTAAPVLSTDCLTRVMDELLGYVEQYKNEIDGICLGLHGAGCAEGIDDLETYVLTEVRKIVGPDMPITVSLDLHGNISPGMIELSNGLFGIKHYPHVDMFDAGYLAMETLIRIIETGKRPQTAYRPLPLVIPSSAGFTFAEPYLEIKKYFDDYRKTHDLIDVTLFHSFINADTPYTRASVLVVADEGAQEAADELGRYIWSLKDRLEPLVLMPDEAMDLAEKVEEPGYVVINELSDNPGGGTPGDGTHLLREMLKRNHEGSIFGYMYDPAAVEEIFSHRIGERIRLTLGGKTEPIHGEPLELDDAEIICMSNGKFIHPAGGIHAFIASDIGQCARIRQGNVDIIIGNVLHQTYDDRPFLVTGADITQYRYVGMKTAVHFRAFFQDKAAAIIPTDPPGLMSGNLALYDFKKMPRPVYPLDRDFRMDDNFQVF